MSLKLYRRSFFVLLHTAHIWLQFQWGVREDDICIYPQMHGLFSQHFVYVQVQYHRHCLLKNARNTGNISRQCVCTIRGRHLFPYTCRIHQWYSEMYLSQRNTKRDLQWNASKSDGLSPTNLHHRYPPFLHTVSPWARLFRAVRIWHSRSKSVFSAI